MDEAGSDGVPEVDAKPFDVKKLEAPFFVPVVLDPTTGVPMIPLYPEQNTEQGGIYVVPMFGSSIYPPVPFAYNTPVGVPLGAEPEDAPAGQQQAGQPARQERVVRFRVGIHVDLLLIVKLMTMVFIFSQDGSRDKLLLLFLAMLVYFYQTGALTPLLRWASERARRAMMPPLPPANTPRPPEAVQPVDHDAGDGPRPEIAAQAAHTENVDIPTENEDVAAAAAEAQAQAGPAPDPAQHQYQLGNWRGFAREVQMIVVGFITSLLPGFHNMD